MLRMMVALLGLVLADAVALQVLADSSSDPLYRESWSSARARIHGRNNVLMDGPGQYPYPRRDDRWVVGVFGGSVARDFAASEGPRAVSEALAADRGRPLKWQSFALSGSGQPTQYHLLRLFHSSVHEAVFLDGFNDLFLPGVPCAAVTRRAERPMPSRDELFRPLRQEAATMRALVDGPWGEVVWETALGRTLYGRRARAASQLLEGFFRGELPGEQQQQEQPPPLGVRVARWTRCVEEAHRFATSRGLRAHFFLQPNQHVRGSKPFSAQERACCLVPPPLPGALPTYAALTEAYAALESAIAGLRARGVSAWSLARVYERTPETVYIDSCCHVNGRGNALMGEAMAAALAAAPTAR